MRKLFPFGSVAAALMMTLSVAQASAQRRFAAQRAQAPHSQVRPAQRQQKQIQKQENKPGVRGALGLPTKWDDKLRQMSPEEQEHFMNNNRKFQSLPPQQQERIRRRMENWNRLSPEQQDAMRNRAQVFNRLSPDERQEVINDIAPRWKALPQDRRELLNGRLRVLRGMTPQQRQQALQDPQFMRGLDDNEQDLLRKVTNLRVGPGPGAQQQPQ
jgi:hypothetical protein